MTKYYPKKPIRSFQDLQVYQLSYNLMVKITNKLSAMLNDDPHASLVLQLADKTPPNETPFMAVPRLIATAHSIRFGDPKKGVKTLENAMLNCNLAIHYLSVTRDLAPKSSELKNREKFRTLTAAEVAKYTKQYLQIRTKILRLQMSWKKFAKNYDQK